MPDKKFAWLETYSQKIVAGLIEQKNKVDTCINWLLTLNTAILSAVFYILFVSDIKATISVSSPIILLAEIGILWTWMIMLRSCRAYRQLVNFDFILKRLNDCQQNPSNRELYMRFLDCTFYLDYPDNKNQRVYKISSNSSIFINLRAEYGIILFILFLIIGYGLSKDSSFINCLSIVFLLILLELTYRGMFYKKELKFDSALNIPLLGFNSMMKIIGLGELHDRLIILKLKEERLKRNVQVYKSEIQKVIRQYKISGREAARKDITDLEKINKEIWKLEYKVRNGNLSHLNFDKVGRIAVKIRDLNVTRVKLKNRINKKTKTGHEDPL